jgi:membrane fusion protein (multidrug efflux system)
MKKRYLFLTIFILGITALIIYRFLDNRKMDSPKSATRPPSAMTVKGSILKPQTFANIISLSGTLEANEEIDIRSEISGIVESINFKEGAKVQKGQVLFRVNDVELRAQLSKVKTG